MSMHSIARMGNIAMNYGVNVNSPISKMSPIIITLFRIDSSTRIKQVFLASYFEILKRNSCSDSEPSN